MARLQDSGGNLLGGLATVIGHTPSLGTLAGSPRTSLNPQFGPEETVPGLVCSFGSFAYATERDTRMGSGDHLRQVTCHNSVETSDERQHCEQCGGDYCTTHAESAAHDCDKVILPG
jgi:hypothetical protein